MCSAGVLSLPSVGAAFPALPDPVRLHLCRLLEGAAAAGGLDPASMMGVLRDRHSGICMCAGSFRSNGAQVSRLVRPAAADGSNGGGGRSPPAAAAAAQHWFTATPDPKRSIFKPFSFTAAGQLDGSPHTLAAPAPINPPHVLWQAWQAVYEGRGGGSKKPSQAALRELEARGMNAGGGLTWAAAVAEELQLYGRV